MEDSFSMYCEFKSYFSPLTTYSSASSTFNSSTSTPRRSIPNELSLGFEGRYGPCAINVELTSPFCPLSGFLFGGKVDTDVLLFNKAIPTTPMKRLEDMATPDYDHTYETAVLSRQSSDSITPSIFVSPYAISATAEKPKLFVATPTHHQSAHEVVGSASSRAYSNESVISLFPTEGHDSLKTGAPDMISQSQSTLDSHPIDGAPSLSCHHAHGNRTEHKIKKRTSVLQCRQIRTSHKLTGSELDSVVDVIRPATCRCDYLGCQKTFRRSEHLKRHKQTFHGEGPNRFSCEFCGKNQFNRQDNLNNHRKLHARRNSRTCGVQFIAAAVLIIKQEEHNRRPRAPSKSRAADWCRDDEHAAPSSLVQCSAGGPSSPEASNWTAY